MRNYPSIVPIVLLLSFFNLARADEKPSSSDAKPAAKSRAKSTARPKTNRRDDDLAAIRATSQAFITAFNSKNAKALAALWTEDGDYVDESGREFVGRKAIEDEYAQFFKSAGNVKLKIVIDSLRLLSDTAAIEDGRAMLDPAPAGAPAISKYTVVHVNVGGKWLMSTVRDVRVETPSAYRNVEDLQWLIGTWTAEEQGAKSVAVCRWIANKSFVERTYTVTHHDQSTSSGVQLIGFNPQGGHVQSWNFTSDGGHAVGVWTPRDGGWQATVVGITGDGVSTSAVNLLTRIDDNAYAWQSVQRTAGNSALADTDEIIIRRGPLK